MMRFEGERDYAMAASPLWEKLHDVRFLLGCIPGVESVSQSESGYGACVLRPGFSFVRGTLEVTIRAHDEVAARSVRFHVTSKGIGSQSAVEATLELSSRDAGSRVHWLAEVTQLGGLLKAVPAGLIKASAQKVIGDVWKSIDNQLAAQV